MSNNPQDLPSLFTHVDVTSNASPVERPNNQDTNGILIRLLEVQERQTELMEEMLQNQLQQQKQRSTEINNWRQAHPQLAKKCHKAAEALSKVHTEFLDTLAEEVGESAEDMVDSEYMLNEFVDRFGPRIAHLNGVLQMLAQLGAPNVPTKPGGSAK